MISVKNAIIKLKTIKVYTGNFPMFLTGQQGHGLPCLLFSKHLLEALLNEPYHEKTCLLGF